jgi:CDP-diacylglycerol--glycerol-3-phosphate 3-phosphatidyltransferase
MPGVFAHWPNRITALRFLGALALFTLFALWGEATAAEVREERGMLTVAFWLFIVTSLSDILDGWLARRGNLITAFGRIADPFVDKVLVLGAMIFLAVMPWSRPWFPAWVVVVILAREFLVTGIRGYVESLGGEFPADWFGKVKMLTQCFAIGVVIGMFAFDVSLEFWGVVADIFVIATLLTSVGSGLSYVIKTRQVLAESGR